MSIKYRETFPRFINGGAAQMAPELLIKGGKVAEVIMIRCGDKIRLGSREINQLTTLLGRRPLIRTTHDYELVLTEIKKMYFGLSAEEKMILGVVAKIEENYRSIL